ncbi:RHS repeat domain-containing protein [Flexithrix dorotheae]|uniref:RHS repeat domain-containing protein n=1 Tax=Flexithrix dorotheae TaxID=70993 RepID=UPI000381BF5D|nr:RHS repeat domain-containing protein [Flexithrix dorotheae]
MNNKYQYLGKFNRWIFNLCISSLIGIGSTVGQELPEIIPPSPEAAAFVKYADIPVNTYNGLPNISIPIYTIQVKDITVPIDLSYHASGIKVNEEASWVGLGWALNAGGVISRTVMGKDDFKDNLTYFNTNIPEIPVYGLKDDGKPQIIPEEYSQFGCSLKFFNRAALPNEPTIPIIDFSPYIEAGNISNYDFEPDQFSFNVGGATGKFILGRDKKVYLTSQDKVTINPIGDDASKWEIQTADGFLYEFDQYEDTPEDGYTGAPFIKTAWYLTKITSPTSGESVTFNYVTNNANPIITIGSRQERINDTGNCQTSGMQVFSKEKREYKKVTLESIDFKNGQVQFVTGDRDDVFGDKKLEKILIYKKNALGNLEETPIKEFDFSYDYFYGSAPNRNNWPASSLEDKYFSNRLKLDKLVEKSGSLTKGAHEFEYYEPENQVDIPAKNSFARDYWGYYNGETGNSQLIPAYTDMLLPDRFIEGTVNSYLAKFPGAKREPNPRVSNIFSLKKIIYPTKGSTSFEYENHTYDWKKSQENNGALLGFLPNIEEKNELFTYDVVNQKGEIIEKTLDISNGYFHGSSAIRVKVKGGFRFSTKYEDAKGVGSEKVYFELYNEIGGRISHVDLFGDVNCTSTEQYCEYDNEYLLPPGVYTWKAFADGEVTGIQDLRATYTWDAIEGKENSAGIVDESQFSIAGGLRIKRIIDHDGITSDNDKIRAFEYHYEEDKDGNGISEEYSFGKRMAKPIYGHYEYSYKIDNRPPPSLFNNGGGGGLFVDNYVICSNYIRTSDSNVPLNGTAGGSIVGYDQVTVKYLKGANDTKGLYGKTSFQYENQPDEIFNYNYYRPPGLPNLSSNRNGLLVKQIDFNSQGDIVKEITNTYNQPHNANILYYYAIKPLVTPKTLSPGAILTSPCDITNFIYPAMKSEWVQLLSTTERIYDQKSSTGYFETITEYKFEPDGPKHYQRIATKKYLDNGDVLEEEMKYPLDLGTTFNADKLADKHIHNVPVQQFTRQNGNVTFKKQTTFKQLGNTTIAKQMDEVFPNGKDAGKIIINYIYDENTSNLKQVQREDGMYITYLWGYKNQYPIAKIENATVAQVEAALGGSIPDFESGGLSVSQEDNLRDNLPESMIYTFQYDPLKGLTATKDPNGRKSTYVYDELGRLKYIKDFEDNIIQKQEYHYRQ